MSDSEFPVPPATFEFLTLSMKTQAEMLLGLLQLGEEHEKHEPDFRAARFNIDMLAMLQDKTKGNLSIEESRLLENSLTELRFRFVQVMEQEQKNKAEAGVEEASRNEGASHNKEQAGS